MNHRLLKSQCLLLPHPPSGFSLIFSSTIITINPPTEKIPKEITKSYNMPPTIFTTGPKHLNTALTLCRDYYVATPQISNINTMEYIHTYPPETPIYITKDITAYFLDPPPTGTQQYDLFLETPFLTIMIATRITYTPNPPPVDLILTYEDTLKNAQKITKKTTELPYYLGGDAKLCIVLARNDRQEQQIIYINKKTYLIQRHLTQINIIET